MRWWDWIGWGIFEWFSGVVMGFRDLFFILGFIIYVIWCSGRFFVFLFFYCNVGVIIIIFSNIFKIRKYETGFGIVLVLDKWKL